MISKVLNGGGTKTDEFHFDPNSSGTFKAISLQIADGVYL